MKPSQAITPRHRFSFVALVLVCIVTVGWGSSVSHGSQVSDFPLRLTVGGTSLHRVGTGLREFFFFDIYTLGAYSESGACDPAEMITRDEAKYIRLRLERDIPRERMTSTLKDSLEKNLLPGASEGLKRQVGQFLALFRTDLKGGTLVEIAYLPGKGTILKQGGRRLGSFIVGKDLSDTIWRAYFGRDTCCSDLKADILRQCRAQG
ncbi:MAG: chalcone isomerase family protein [Nannocystaceae bacterium]